MGYTTDFEGQFICSRKLTEAEAAYLRAFNGTRRMKRELIKAAVLPDPVRVAVDLPVGREGRYFVGGKGEAGQDRDSSILDYNDPPIGQPGLWCGWTVAKGDAAIKWDGVEKFYEYAAWLEYLILNFLEPWGIRLSGSITFQGEDREDFGTIRVIDTEVSIQKGERGGNVSISIPTALLQKYEGQSTPSREDELAEFVFKA